MSASATASRTEIGLVYVAAVVQGLALVTFPAASSIFTSPDGFGFDSTRYGALFLPQVLLAILASALPPAWHVDGLRPGAAGRICWRYRLDDPAGAEPAAARHARHAFGVLLLATGALGLGFGATVMALNTYAEAFFPERPDRAVLALNALLGLGTALAPVLVPPSWCAGPMVAPSRDDDDRPRGCRDPGLRAAAATGTRNADAARPRSGSSPVPLLALCRRGLALRRARDPDRQLGNALSQPGARRIAPRRLVRPDGFLDHGHPRPRDHRSPVISGPGPPDVCRPAGPLSLAFVFAGRADDARTGMLAFGLRDWRARPCCRSASASRAANFPA